MADIIVILLIGAVVAAAIVYIRKEKRRGVRCVGCPAAGTCGHHQSGSSCGGCSGQGSRKK